MHANVIWEGKRLQEEIINISYMQNEHFKTNSTFASICCMTLITMTCLIELLYFILLLQTFAYSFTLHTKYLIMPHIYCDLILLLSII